MRKILLTGFTPFGVYTQNPSQVLCQSLQGFRLADIAVVTHILPVDWQEAQLQLQSLLQQGPWCGVVLTGLAAQRRHLTLETRACNLRHERSSNHDQTDFKITGEKIIMNSPDEFLKTKINLIELMAMMKTDPATVEIGSDAGTYLCNYVYYLALDYLRQHKIEIPALFIHLPLFPDENHQTNPDINIQKKVLLQVLEFIQKNY